MRAYVFADVLGRTLSFKGYKLTHVINITDVGHLTDDADAGEDKLEKAAADTGAVDLGHRAALYRGLLGRRQGAQHPPAGAVDDRDRLRPADDRVRARASRTSTATSWTAGSISTSRPSPITAASPAPRRRIERGEGRIEAGRRQAPRRRFRHLAQDPAGREPPDGMGFALGPGRAGLASRMLGDERRGARLSVRHPHRRHRPPRDPPPQRDRPEPGALLHQWARMRQFGASIWMHNNFLVERSGKMSKVVGRVPAAATADRQGVSPAGLPADVPAGALPERAGVQLGGAGGGADAVEADGDGG